MRLLKTMLLLAFGLISFEVGAQSELPPQEQLDALDKQVQEFLATQNIPGGLVAVASKGRIIHIEPYGMANVELAVPVSEKTVFEIGSISKQFVAAAAMLLVEDGKLKLDDPIHKYLPYLPGEWMGVTMKQLLNHTSGIPDYEEIRSYDAYRFRMTPEEIIKIAQSRPVDFTPGQGWYYSNTGYYLASMVLERIEGQPLGRILKDRIFGPLGMTSTRLADPEAIIPNRAAGYWVNKVNELINRNPTETSSTLGAGGLLSNAGDLAKWDAALYGDGFLSASSKAAMWSPAILPNSESTGYALGWSVTPYKGLVSQHHSGQVAGFTAFFDRFPDQEVAVIIFLNRYRIRGRIKDTVLDVFLTGRQGGD